MRQTKLNNLTLTLTLSLNFFCIFLHFLYPCVTLHLQTSTSRHAQVKPLIILCLVYGLSVLCWVDHMLFVCSCVQ